METKIALFQKKKSAKPSMKTNGASIIVLITFTPYSSLTSALFFSKVAKTSSILQKLLKEPAMKAIREKNLG